MLALSGLPGTVFAADIYIDSKARAGGNGTQAFPYRSMQEAPLRSGNRYLLRRGGTYPAPIEIGGVENVVVEPWGKGQPPVVGNATPAAYGVRVFSTRNVTVSGLELKNFTGACILAVGSVNYRIQNNRCSDALYGVAVNAGRLGPGGLIEGNRINRVKGDGIGAWNLPPGVVIRNNHIFDFGNDGIDILGSRGAVIEGNIIHDSTDYPDIPKSAGHSGIKAGGNVGAGGGNNTIVGNTIYRVKNFGIYNRSAVGNVYRYNICYENGVNYNFVNPEEPSMAVIEGNLARSPTFEAGLEYSVYIPPAHELRSASSNTWQDGLVRVKAVGMFSAEASYLRVMQPVEQNTRF